MKYYIIQKSFCLEILFFMFQLILFLYFLI